MQKPCKQCNTPFEIIQEDLDFYNKVSPVINGKKYPIPEPTLCPDCRQQRRLAHCNEFKLFQTKCDLCGKATLTEHSPSEKKDPILQRMLAWRQMGSQRLWQRF
jgi:hypothetical protein